ncbi:MAG TPA: nuclear transport factor 2 family protein [Terriglobia bacterium]|nr:nuclear transport factor 2 family protein [Terriglobia bacterium]
MNVPETVLAAMRKTNALFNSQVVEGQDVAALDQVYTRSARVLPPGAPMLEGREQAKGFWKDAIKAVGLRSAKLTTVNAEAVGDSVVEIGRAELLVGSGQTVTVKYVVQWKQEDGDWRWHVDIWNANE